MPRRAAYSSRPAHPRAAAAAWSTAAPSAAAWTSRGRAALAALALAVVLAVVLAVAAPVGPARAHDALNGSTPADGAQVELAPASVELSFAQPPLALGSEVQVTGPDGQVVNAGDLVLSGTTVSQPLAPGLPAGEYAVVWRVTSADGHPISGELSFTAAGSAAAEPAPTDDAGDASGQPTPEPTSTAPEPPTISPGTGTQDAGAAGGAGDAGGAGATPWLVGAVLLLAGGAAAWWAARRRSAPTPPSLFTRDGANRDHPSAGP